MAEKATSLGNLQGFLKPAVIDQVEERVISDRFLDKGKKPIPFKVRAISQDINNQLVKKHTKTIREKGTTYEKLNKDRYQAELICTCCVQPDFTQKDICDAYGVIDPLLVPQKMLFAGEYAKLVDFIMETNNFRDAAELEEDAKNFSTEMTRTQD